MHVIDRHTLEQTLDLDDALHCQREAFLALHRGEIEQPLRSRFDWPAIAARTLVMPAMRQDHPLLTMKIVQVSDAGSVSGQIWVMDTRTQTPLAIMDAEAITLLRTAATSALSAQVLAAPQAKTLAIFGAGEQAAWHARAMLRVRNLERIRIWARKPERAQALAAELGEELNIPVDACVETAAALDNADIVCTCTPANSALFDARELPVATHIIAIGAFRPDMCELPTGAFADAFVCADDPLAAQREAGDLINAGQAGTLDWSRVRTLGEQFAQVAAHQPVPRPASRTIFKSLGLAMQDHAMACLALERLGLFRA